MTQLEEKERRKGLVNVGCKRDHFTMFGINTIFLSPSLEAKFDREVCPSAKLTRGEP